MDKVVATALETVADVPDGATLAVGASGARLVGTVTRRLAREGGGVGVGVSTLGIGIGIGIGQGLALVLER